MLHNMGGLADGVVNKYLFWGAVLAGILVVVMGLFMFLESS
jgi:cytochrome b subunit of formate dehydrogenase